MGNIRPTFAIVVLVVSCVHVQAQTREHLNVASGRPVATAVNILEKKYGWVITYEDPEYVNDADLRDATPPWYVPANHPPNLQKIIVPRGGALNFEYPVVNGHPTEDTGNLLSRMIESYGLGSHPEFQVLHRNMPVGALQVTEWHVVPTKVLDKDGNLSPADPILDTVIAIPSEKRTALEMVGAICQELSRVMRKRVVVGMVPLNPLMNNARERSAPAQPARDILADTLNRERPGYSWELYYDPSGFYALNVHWIDVHVTPPVPRRQPQ